MSTYALPQQDFSPQMANPPAFHAGLNGIATSLNIMNFVPQQQNRTYVTPDGVRLELESNGIGFLILRQQ